MRFSLLILAYLLSLLKPGNADLNELLKWQQVGDPGAYVSSGFHDWRGVSKYRSRPGLHAGYDIAMWANSVVRTPWPGRVEAITPWYGREYGITIILEDGHRVTFGHLSPLVKVGTQVVTGQEIGLVVVDHVDVKVQNLHGQFVDIGIQPLKSSALLAEKSRPQPLDKSGEIRIEQAYTEYTELQAKFSQQKHKAELGLLAQNVPDKTWKEMQVLLPLARQHRDWSEEPQTSPDRLRESAVSNGRRPVADSLLYRAAPPADE